VQDVADIPDCLANPTIAADFLVSLR